MAILTKIIAGCAQSNLVDKMKCCSKKSPLDVPGTEIMTGDPLAILINDKMRLRQIWSNQLFSNILKSIFGLSFETHLMGTQICWKLFRNHILGEKG